MENFLKKNLLFKENETRRGEKMMSSVEHDILFPKIEKKVDEMKWNKNEKRGKIREMDRE